MLRNNSSPAPASSTSQAATTGRIAKADAGIPQDTTTSVSLFDLARAAVAEQDAISVEQADDNVLAVARLGGPGSRVWVYRDAIQQQQQQQTVAGPGSSSAQSWASFGGTSHRQWF